MIQLLEGGTYLVNGTELVEPAKAVAQGLPAPEEAEKQTKEFDASLEKETSDEIRKIREDLAREKDARINELRAETEDQLSRLDAYYEAHHESLCSELFQKITGITET